MAVSVIHYVPATVVSTLHVLTHVILIATPMRRGGPVTIPTLQVGEVRYREDRSLAPKHTVKARVQASTRTCAPHKPLLLPSLWTAAYMCWGPLEAQGQGRFLGYAVMSPYCSSFK